VSYKDDAKQNAANGYNCCQSVFAAFCEDLGLDRDTGLKISSGFGAGVCRGEICGAVSGAVMALGLKKGFYIESDDKGHERIVELTKKFMKAFEEKHGSIICKELLGCDISKTENYEKVVEEGVFEKVCRNLIGSSAELVEGFIKE